MQQSVGGHAKHLDLETSGSAANADWGPQGWGPQSLLIKHGDHLTWWALSNRLVNPLMRGHPACRLLVTAAQMWTWDRFHTHQVFFSVVQNKKDNNKKRHNSVPSAPKNTECRIKPHLKKIYYTLKMHNIKKRSTNHTSCHLFWNICQICCLSL